MRKLLVLFLSFFSLSATASHVLGGNITWDCLGNNQYQFSLVVYRECSLSTASLPGGQTINGPNGNIAANLMSAVDISSQCSGGSGVFCGMTGAAQGAVEKYTYRSSVITLTGSIPNTGWEFSWSNCCRPGTMVNTNTGPYFISSKMYPSNVSCSSSPEFVANMANGLTTSNFGYSVMALSLNSRDSLYYRLTAPLQSANTSIVFNTGYSATSPFPSDLTNPANSPVQLDPQTGYVSLNIVSATAGAYCYAVTVEQWRNNVLLSEVTEDAVAFYKSGTPANTSPNWFVDTANYPLVHYGSLVSSNKLYSNVYPGDTIIFELLGSDMDFNTGTNVFQQISFNAKGAALDSNWGGVANFISQPQISPVSPQTGYVQQLSSVIRFSWAIGQEHITTGRGPHTFQFEFVDDHCPFPGRSIINLEVNVGESVSVSNDSLGLCSGDSVQLSGFTATGNYVWYPNNNMSADSVPNPMVWPSSSQYYYLTDPSTNAPVDSVFIDVTVGGTYNLAFQSGQLAITGNAQPNFVQWYYNGIPFSYAHDTLTPFGLGDYYIKAQDGNCLYVTDTITVTSGTSLAISQGGNGTYNGAPIPFSGSLGTTFQVNKNVNINWVAIPGLVDIKAKTGSGYNLNLKVYDASQTEVFNTDVVLTKPLTGLVKVPVSVSLLANTDYTITISGDTSYAFSLIENVILPSTPYNVGLTVKSLLEGAHSQFPTNSSNYLLPIGFGIDQMVGLHELEGVNLEIYPNPAGDKVSLKQLEGVRHIQLMNMTGKVVKEIEFTSEEDELIIYRDGLASGVYILSVQFKQSQKSYKLVFE